MEFSNTNSFIQLDFLLQSKTAEQLYFQYAEAMPVIDYHNHLSPEIIAKNQPFRDINAVWLDGDHYKWRAMRTLGIEEKFITGNASSKEKFDQWAKTVPYTVGNPLFHWTHLELKRYFNISELLQPSSSDAIFEETNHQLKSIASESNVEKHEG